MQIEYFHVAIKYNISVTDWKLQRINYKFKDKPSHDQRYISLSTSSDGKFYTSNDQFSCPIIEARGQDFTANVNNQLPITERFQEAFL